MKQKIKTMTNKELIKEVRSLQQVLTLGMITVEDYNDRFSTLMSNYNKEYKRQAQSVRH
jgi:hypothetical protein